MANIGVVVLLTGSAIVVNAQGVQRQLALGDSIQAGDTIVAPKGTTVELQLANGNVVQISAQQTVTFTQELSDAILYNLVEPSDNAVSQATIQSLIQAINSGDNIDDIIKALAEARNEGFNLDHTGHTFVDLLRVDDVLNQFDYNYDVASRQYGDDNPLEQDRAATASDGITRAVNLARIDQDLNQFNFDYNRFNNNFNSRRSDALRQANDPDFQTPSNAITPPIAPVNSRPNASAATASGNEDSSSIHISLAGTDTGGTIASVRVTTLPLANQGVLYLADGVTPVLTTTALTPAQAASLVFVPTANFNGAVNVPFVVTDNAGSVSLPANVAITVVAVNDTPVIAGVNAGTVAEDGTLASTGTLTISDADAGQSSFQPQTSVATTYGNFTINSTGNWVYNLNNASPAVQALGFGANLTDVITVLSADGTPTTVTITINGANDAPIAQPASATVAEDAALLSGNVVATDVDSTAVLTYTLNGAPPAGLVFNSNGSYSFDSANAAYQSLAVGGIQVLTIPYTVTDDQGATSTANLIITVTGTNDGPIANDDIASTPFNTAVNNIAVLANDTDPDTGDTLTVTGATVSAALGAVLVNGDGTLNFTPSATVVGAVPITYTISDGKGGTITATLIVNVGTNTPPDGTDVTRAFDEDTSRIIIAADFGFTDVDVPAQSLVNVRIDSLPANGSLTLNGNPVVAGQIVTVAAINLGQLVFTPVANANGVNYANFTFSVQDSAGGFDASPNTVTFNVNPVNDAAVITGTSSANLTESNVAQNTGGSLSATDVDSSNAFIIQTGAAGSNGYGNFSIDAAGVWTYAMNSAHNEFAAGTNYTDSITVATSDGTTQVITVTIAGTNDAAIITGTSSANLTESNVAQNTGGSLSATDVDSSNAFIIQTGAAGSNGYGNFSIDAAGVWTYAMNSAHNEFAAGTNYTDSITVATSDGTNQTITVTIAGTNDAAVITGTSTANLTESNVAQNTGGTLTATDVDSSNAFIIQTGAAGSNGYGNFSIDAAGVWTYAMNSAHNEFAAGTNYTDSITVATSDGTTQVITVTIAGTNDAAVITGTSTANLTENNVAQNTGGTLTATDVDSSNAFIIQTGAAGSNGYGNFSIDAAGVWTYAMNSAHNEFAAGTNYTDSITVATSDGTNQTITVTIAGTNDAAVITGTSTANLTESNVAQNTGGTLTATDVDSSNAFIIQTGAAGSNGYGNFSIDAAGVWTYAMNSAHNEFAAGTNYTDSITVATSDGTTQVITVTIAGTNDAAIITGTSTANLTESNVAQNTGGTLTATDVDSSNAFIIQTGAAGSNGYGNFSIDAAGVWTYAMNSAHNEFAAGTNYTDSITVATSDGTTQVITVTIAGTNDAAIITGTSTANLTESNVAQNTGGTLTATDVDSSNAFIIQTGAAGSNGYGNFSIDAAGVWTYAMNSAHNEFAAGTNYTDSITVTTSDGTNQTITVTIAGTNDAAVITGTSTANLTESNVAQNTGGTLTATDVDSSNAFIIQTGAAGSNGYGNFSIDAAGVWTYAMNSAHNEFAAGTNYTDSITVATSDGTTQVITVTIAGTNDAAVITGTSTANLTENNVAQNTGGSLSATDVDSSNAFIIQTGAAGSNGYGNFSIDAAGVWTYAMNSAHNEFAAGTNYTDSITVATSDGTTQVITVTIAGTNDAAIITGTSTANLTENNVAQNTGGTLTATDVDSSNAFIIQTGAAGSNGYGNFSIDAAGVWTYAMNSAHNEFAAGTNYTDSITVATSDGTTQVITVTIAGTNDAAIITGTSTANLTESNVAQNTGGTLTATDVDSSNAFIIQTGAAGSNGYGNFSIDAAGVWTYAMNSAHNEFAAGTNYTDSITVATSDGTTQVITVTIAGTNDAAIITGTSTANLTESNVAQNTGGTLTATDVDSSNAFIIQTGAAGSNGYGNFSIDAAGVWTYAMNSAHNEFAAGTNYTDSITVATSDGTTQVITVTIAGTNDAAIITGTSTANLTESNVAQNTGGTLTATDVDSSNAFIIQTGAAGSNGYGNFSIDAAGVWTYAMNSAHNEFAAGTNYTDSITVATSDGTNQTITVTIAGTNDAAVITGTSTANLTENNVAQNTGGSLSATDVDSSNAFIIQTGAAGSNGYGNFSIDAAGVWTYAMNSAHNEFAAGTNYTDSITVATSDGTTQVITVTIAGTNDAAIITGTSTANLTESNVAQNTGGTLTATDVDSSNAFIIQTGAAGSNGYGNFSIDAAGVWTYAMNSAHNEFAAGTNYTDSITVATSDGTTQVITVTIAGTNDAAIITGTSSANLTESNVAQNTGGTLTATDVDSSNAFIIQTGAAGSNGYGNFSIDAAGVWTYAMNSAHNEFAAGTNYTDSITVATSDGTTQVITVTIAGTNDAAIITGTSTANLTESNVAQNTGGTLTATDVDSSNAFIIQTGAAGSNGYGNFSIDAAGVWTYAMNSAHNEFAAGTNYTDSITVATSDGTNQTITVTIAGTNDAAIITGTTTGTVVEASGNANAVAGTPTATGTLADTDVDNPPNTFQAVSAGAATIGGYGTYAMTAGGVWTYTLNNNNAAVQALRIATNTLTDTFNVLTVDGTTQLITVTIQGGNDTPIAVLDGNSVVESGVNPGNTAFAGTPSATGNVMTNDTDVDSGDTKTVSAVNGVAGNVGLTITGTYGTVNIANDGSYTYTLNNALAATQALAQGAAATDVFSYTMVDTAGAASTTNLTITVTGTNDVPTAAGTTNTAAEDVASVTVVLDGADVDGTVASFTLSSLPANGTLYTNAALTTVAATGTAYAATGNALTLYFKPNADWNGSTTLNFTATDNNGAVSTSATETITITAAPDIVADIASTLRNSPVTINVLGNDTFENAGRTITAVNGTAIVDGGPAVAVTNGSVQLVSGNLVFTPTGGYAGAVPVFTYTVTSGGVPETADVNVTVIGVASITSPTVAENAVTAPHLVTLTGATTSIITMPFNIANVTAMAGSDYNATPTFTNGVTLSGGVLTIPLGVTTFTINVPITNDTVFEANETYNITLDNVVSTGTITNDDLAPTITGVSTATAVEGAAGTADLVHTVTLSNASSTATTFAYVVTPNTATTADFNFAPTFSNGVTLAGGTITVPAGVTSFTISYDTIQDTNFEGNETYQLQVGGIGAANNGTITDDEVQPSISVSSVTVSEVAGSFAIFTVSLSGASATTVNAALTFSAGTPAATGGTAAGAAVDYRTNNTNVSFDGGATWSAATTVASFASGITSVLVRVPIDDNADATATERFNLIATPGAGQTLNASATGTATILETNINIGDNNATEGTGIVHNVTLTAFAANTDVYFNIVGVTATGGGVDFNSAAITFSAGVTLISANVIRIPAGVANFTITVPTFNDTINENAETYTITVAGENATGTINDNDNAPTIASVSTATAVEGLSLEHTVTLTAVSGIAETYAFLLTNGTAGSPADFNAGGVTFSNGVTLVGANVIVPAGVTSFTVTVPTVQNAIFELTENYRLQVGGVGAANNGTITDDDVRPTLSVSNVTVVENAGFAVFQLSLSGLSSQAIGGTLGLTAGTAVTPADYTNTMQVSTDGGTNWSANTTAFSIAAGATSVLVRVPIINTQPGFEAAETFTLNATAITNANNTTASGTGTIIDTTAPTISIADVTVNESAGTASFTVTLSATSTQTITVSYNTSSISALVGADFTNVSGTLTFAAGTTTQTITVPITDDTGYEIAETFRVTLSSPSNATILDGQATGTISLNDTPTLAVSSFTVSDQAAGFATFIVSLSNPSSVATSFSLALANGTATGGGNDYGSATATNLQVSTDNGATWSNATTATIQINGTYVLVRTPIIADVAFEVSETFTLTATRTAGVTTNASAVGTATITDIDNSPNAVNDAPAGTLQEDNPTVTTLSGNAILGGSGNVADSDPNNDTLAITGAVSGTGGVVGSAALASALTVSGVYGNLVINANGSYTYTLDNSKIQTQNLINLQTANDVFTYKITDGNGGFDTATITVSVVGTLDITAIVPQPVLVTAGGLTAEYYGYNETTTPAATNRAHADDGLATSTILTTTTGNVDSIEDLEFIVNTRNVAVGGPANIAGSAVQGATNAADVIFNVRTLNYGITPLVTGGLFSNSAQAAGNALAPQDNNAGSTTNALANFLDQDASTAMVQTGAPVGAGATVGVNTGLGTTTDAIIRITGMAYLERGNYDFQVLADDGFRLKIGGETLIEFDGNQGPTSRTFNNVEVSDLISGLTAVELLYWDQGGQAQVQFNFKLSSSNTWIPFSLDSIAYFSAATAPMLTDTRIQDIVETAVNQQYELRTGSVLDGDENANTLTGNAGRDYIQGFGGADILNGGGSADFLDGGADNDTINSGAGNDIMIGGTGNDAMTGGLGDDIYRIDNALDTTTEAANEGTDTIEIDAAYNPGAYTLTANFENLLINGAFNVNGTGNALNNRLTGSDGNNSLSGLAGNDRLIGGKGNDTLTGGADNDIFEWNLADKGTAGAPAIDTITDFVFTGAAIGTTVAKTDTLDLRDLLVGEASTLIDVGAGQTPDIGNLLRYLDVVWTGTNTEIRISSGGNYNVAGTYNAAVEDQRIVIAGVNLFSVGTPVSTDETMLLQRLLKNGTLIVD